MSLTPVQPLIEASDFTGGWAKNVEVSQIPQNQLIDVKNLLLDVSNGAVVTRKGFRRLVDNSIFQGYKIMSLHPYSRITAGGVREDWLIAVASNNTTIDNNVIVVAIELKVDTNNVFTGRCWKVSPTDTWNDKSGRHWGATIDGFFYGGSEKDEMYRWHPDGGAVGTFVQNVGQPSYTRHQDSASPGANPIPRDTAFREGDTVLMEYTKASITYTDAFSAQKSNRFQKWIQGTDAAPETYIKGNKVSLKVSGVWKSFKCIKKHDSTTSTPRTPGPSTAYWQKIRLDNPVNEDGELSNDWSEVADAPMTAVAVWHGQRLFARHDKVGKQMLVYSPAAKNPVAGETKWDPKDWRIRLLQQELTAGYQPFETEDGDDISALYSFGYYLLVFKERSTHVISGYNPKTWTPRQLAPVGCIGPRAMCEHEGIIYFVGDEGFFETNGTEVAPVPGSEKITPWLLHSISQGIKPHDITLWSHRGYVWISLPTDKGNEPNLVVLYDPVTQSFWPQDLEIQDVAIGQLKDIDQLFFVSPSKVGIMVGATYSWGTISGGVFTPAINPLFPHALQSRRITTEPNTEYNLFRDPSFEFDAFGPFGTPSLWTSTDGQVRASKSPGAAFRGEQGLRVTNTRPTGYTGGSYGGYEGKFQSISTRITGTHTIQVTARRPNWEKNPSKKPDIKLYAEGPGVLTPTFTYLGNGKWLAYAQFTVSSASTKTYSPILVAPDTTVDFDKVMLSEGVIRPYFDGTGGDEAGDKGTKGGDRGLVYWYDHPGASNADDQGGASYVSQAFGWLLRTAWFPFGVAREERRIRRLWALIRGEGLTVGLRTFLNYKDEEVTASTATSSAEPGATYFEGQLPPDGYALNIELAGLSAPGAVMGIAADTEFRRVRFGS